MNLYKAVSTLTMAMICSLPLAVSTGCTGPPRGTETNGTATQGTEESTNTSQPNEIDEPFDSNDYEPPFSDDYSNTTN